MSIRYILRVWPHHTRIQGQQRLKQACLILRWCYRRFLCSQLCDFTFSSLQLRLKSGGLMTSEQITYLLLQLLVLRSEELYLILELLELRLPFYSEPLSRNSVLLKSTKS